MYNYFYAKKSTFRRNIMKERYNIEISDIQLSVVSDEPEDFVNSIVEKINERVNDLIVRNKRCSKLDAALLCALDYCGECTKAEKRIRNLEAQTSLYDANLKRMREELAASQKASPAVKSALGIKDSADDDTEDKAPERRNLRRRQCAERRHLRSMRFLLCGCGVRSRRRSE